MVVPSSSEQFSFDHLVSEVDTIVEDLRWLHLELTLRNRCNEIIFQEISSIEDLLEHAFKGIRQKLSVIEFSVFLKERESFRVGYHEIDESVIWKTEQMPWGDMIKRIFNPFRKDIVKPHAEVNHYSLNAQPITSIAMPIVLNTDRVAVLLLIAPTSNIIPRLKKLLMGVAGSLGLSIDYIRNRRSTYAEIPQTHSYLSKHHGETILGSSKTTAVDKSAANERNLRYLFDMQHTESCYILILDKTFNIRFINSELEKLLEFSAEWYTGRRMTDVLVPVAEQATIARILSDHYYSPLVDSSHCRFHLRIRDGRLLPTTWQMILSPDGSTDEVLICCIGAPISEEYFEAATSSQISTPPNLLNEARLAKQYRFMMKYVPFPVFHLDDTSDVIKNANPSFEQIIGTKNWEGIPLTDFATLEIQGGSGETRPCRLYVLNPNGITLSYRGIITQVTIFGKTTREVKLDTIE